MLRLILVRHGETEWNSEQRLQGGRSDIPLNENGEEQARRLGLALRKEKLTAVYSSPLQRAVTTAQAVAAHHGISVQTDPDLVEMDLGDLDGLNLVGVRDSRLDFWQQWRQGDCSMPIPGGESLVQVQQRVWPAVQRIIQQHRTGTVVLVGHSFVVQTVIFSALAAPIECFARFRISPTGITILHLDGERTTLMILNDTCHLEK